MEHLVVECLQCGTTRIAERDRFNHFESPECPQCGYLGWTPVLDATETECPVPHGSGRREQRPLPSVA